VFVDLRSADISISLKHFRGTLLPSRYLTVWNVGTTVDVSQPDVISSRPLFTEFRMQFLHNRGVKASQQYYVARKM
jgi:hypothetical protein